jgi:hypothetical protein
MELHADFAVPVTHNLFVTTTAQPDDTHGPISGQVIAFGWWVQPETADDPDHQPAGTLYLVVDGRRPRPMWVRQSALVSVRIDEG